MKKHRFLSQLHILAAKALASGGERVNLNRVIWNCGGNCIDPFWTSFHAVPSRPEGSKWVIIGQDTSQPMTVEIATRCRKCDACLRQRSALWRERAKAELSHWPRTWFGTLTVRPDEHYMTLCRVAERLRLRENEFAALRPDEQFRLLAGEHGKEITKMLKRLREAHGTFRFLLVSEAHQSGLPHWHILLHEKELGQIKYDALEGAWPKGFTKWKLAEDTKPASYLAKYLSKNARSRVRASLAYGSPEPSTRLPLKAQF